MTTTVLAHFDGKHSLVLDEPVELPVGTPLRVHVETVPRAMTQRLPLTLELDTVRAMVTDTNQPWRPLDVEIDPKLGEAISQEPEFNIEES